MKISAKLADYDSWIADTMYKYGFLLLRISLAITFIWFGILKPLGSSPAEHLVANTVFWFSPDWFVPLLGWWEVLVGVFLLFRKTIRLALFLLFVQLPGTFLPLVLLPEVTFTSFPIHLTMEGQYIVKNLIIIAAAIVVGGTVGRRAKNGERM